MHFVWSLLLAFGIWVGYNAQPAGNLNYVCREGEEYDTCRSPCEATCDNINSRNQTNCSRSCTAGCFCKNGLIRAHDNRCILPYECNRSRCQENEEFSECGFACEMNCTNLNDAIFCTKPCYQGCFCKPNFVRDSTRRCVHSSTCNDARNRQCGPNEKYVLCVSFCNTCWELNLCRTPFCHPGCDCLPGFYRNYYGECISESQCYKTMYGLQNVCGENEIYTDCVNPCNDCASRGRCSYHQYYCEPGCDCERGYLRNEMGICVPEHDCYRQVCYENEIYSECGPSCRTTCANYQQLHYNSCKQDCIPGCYCQGNFVLGPNGRCINPTFCPPENQEKCPLNEQYYVCMPACRNTCENYNDTNAVCRENCSKGCFCKSGLVRRNDGVCVSPRNCPTNNSSCPPGEVFYQCLPTCRTTCKTLNVSNGICSLECQSGCFCQPGFVRQDNGMCVRPEECLPAPPTQSCPPGYMFYNCIPTCRSTCENINSTRACSTECVPGCFCQKGFVKRRDGKCVRPQNCEILCDRNEVYKPCGTACPESCYNLNERLSSCSQRCVQGCFCKEGFVIGPDGSCIHRRDCPIKSTPLTGGTGLIGRRIISAESNTDSTIDEVSTLQTSQEITTASMDLSETDQSIQSINATTLMSNPLNSNNVTEHSTDLTGTSQTITTNEEIASTSESMTKIEKTISTTSEIIQNEESSLTTQEMFTDEILTTNQKLIKTEKDSTTSPATTKTEISVTTNLIMVGSEENASTTNLIMIGSEENASTTSQTSIVTEEQHITTTVTTDFQNLTLTTL